MRTSVKCEAEHRQDRCLHMLTEIDKETARDLHEEGQREYKYQCVKCGRYLKNKNGVMMSREEIQ